MHPLIPSLRTRLVRPGGSQEIIPEDRIRREIVLHSTHQHIFLVTNLREEVEDCTFNPQV